ncbi:zinc finger CCCH domain-containing protein 43 [Vigna radiata var. radiata]|uniref:Zinc finger CCCH domain-containing protein 43 n=1 Tax=Vigna radiata var. radiata TaxID=3916 RepID=A0A1S3TXX9_VIGRR|nr:zinc finger CCCH domain-containing protein 43 [Vigna radiata var. radiata]
MGKTLSRTLDHDPQQSDLNHVAQDDDALNRELQNKLDLKDVSESEDKGSNLEDGGGKLSDEGAAPEGGKGEGSEDDGGGGGDDVVGVVDDDDCNGGDEGCDWIENVNESESDKVGGDVEGVDSRDERSSGRAQQYPLRPEAEDCAYYLKTGSCKFGFNCKFNHPLKRKNQAKKENAGEKEEQAERSGQTECKYYLRSGGCKFGKACKFNHKREKCSSANPIAELNFLGLPIRVGEKECHYYMRNGSCKFGANCKFNHPDPTAGGGDSPSRYDNGSSVSLQGVSQSSISSWSSTRPLNESTPFVPMILSANPGVSPQSSEWDGYQAPVYLPERNMHLPSTYVMNNPVMETNVYMHHQQQVQVEEFPERPGEPECSYFLKTGDCKFKSNCRFHHPKNRITRLPPCSLSNKGLPLRPDQNVCTYYSRYGICKFGPACKFDHPPPSTMNGLDQQSSYSNSASVDVSENGGVSDGNQ